MCSKLNAMLILCIIPLRCSLLHHWLIRSPVRCRVPLLGSFSNDYCIGFETIRSLITFESMPRKKNCREFESDLIENIYCFSSLAWTITFVNVFMQTSLFVVGHSLSWPSKFLRAMTDHETTRQALKAKSVWITVNMIISECFLGQFTTYFSVVWI